VISAYLDVLMFTPSVSDYSTFGEDDRAMNDALAVGMLLGSALVLAAALAVFMLAGG
jgi:hypothetical protein